MGKPRESVLAAINLPPADQVVNELLSETRVKEQEMQLSVKERHWLVEKRRQEKQRKEKARHKEIAQRPNKVSWLLPTDLRMRVKVIAKDYSVPESQVATFLLLEGVQLLDDGKLDLFGHLFPSNSPRYDSQLIHPADTERSQRLGKKRR
jgi:hypothetical protein